jgi:hypothetical protein
MKIFAIALLASLPVPRISSPATPPLHTPQQTQKIARKGGKWYFARTGHAVFCYGPVMTVTTERGSIEHVATFCRGDKLLVPLKD